MGGVANRSPDCERTSELAAPSKWRHSSAGVTSQGFFLFTDGGRVVFKDVGASEKIRADGSGSSESCNRRGNGDSTPTEWAASQICWYYFIYRIFINGICALVEMDHMTWRRLKNGALMFL